MLVPIVERIVAKPKDSLQVIAQHAGRQHLRKKVDDGVLELRRVLVLVDEETRIGCVDDVVN